MFFYMSTTPKMSSFPALYCPFQKQGVFLKVSTYPLSKLSFSLNKLFNSWESSSWELFPRDSFVQLPNFTVDFCWLKTPTTKNLENINSLSLNPHHNLVFSMSHYLFACCQQTKHHCFDCYLTVCSSISNSELPFFLVYVVVFWAAWLGMEHHTRRWSSIGGIRWLVATGDLLPKLDRTKNRWIFCWIFGCCLYAMCVVFFEKY